MNWNVRSLVAVSIVAAQGLCSAIMFAGCEVPHPSARNAVAGFPGSKAQQYYSGERLPIDQIAVIACSPNLYFYQGQQGPITSDVLEVTPGYYEFIMGTKTSYYPNLRYTPEGTFYSRTYEEFPNHDVSVTAQAGHVYYIVVHNFQHSGELNVLDVSSSITIAEKDHSARRRK
jgi:hypothetical protein